MINFPGSEETTFYLDIENHMANSNTTIMEAVIEWCERRNIEIEYVASLIAANPALKAKLQVEAEELNFLKRSKRVQI